MIRLSKYMTLENDGFIGEIPETDTFEMDCTYEAVPGLTVIFAFHNDGTFQLNNEITLDSLNYSAKGSWGDGAYTRKGDIIVASREDGQVTELGIYEGTAYLAYKKQ